MIIIDHKAEAEALTGANASDWRNGDVAVAQQTEAMVHATLYLAEQQRIANLLALTASVMAGVRAGEKPSELVWTRFEAAGKQIVEGLEL